jgi:3-oxoacyl-[acyl-carrier protein] reductase
MRDPEPPLALVTGVTGEIGEAVTRRLWKSGVGVLGVHARAGPRAARLEREAHAGGHELTLARIDLAAPGARERVFELVRRHRAAMRRLAAFLGLAGVAARGVWREPFPRLTRARCEEIYRVDTLSHAWFAQALAPALRRRCGRIVLMSSSAGLVGDVLGVPFALAKAANLALVKSLARLLAPEVAVNGVAPGAIETAWLEELTPAERRRAREKALLARFGRPEEVAGVFYQLAFGEIGFVTGEVLVVDGGATV